MKIDESKDVEGKDGSKPDRSNNGLIDYASDKVFTPLAQSVNPLFHAASRVWNRFTKRTPPTD